MENKDFIFCESCFKEVDCIVKDNIPMIGEIKNIKYKYLGKEAYCKECGSIVYNPTVLEYNIEALYDKCREVNGLISLQKIREIPKKYHIGKRPLSLLLGWGEHTFSRFYEGNLPTKQYSDILVKIYDNPKYYLELLETNKGRLSSSVTYQKSYKATNTLLQHKFDSKILVAAQYLINHCEDITALTLQKALYYTQGLYSAFYGDFIFKDDCEAWVHGPVYRNVYQEYKEYEYRTIQPDKSITDFSCLSKNEITVLNYVSDYFCTFSGKVLEYFTHQEQPWINCRKGMPLLAASDKIIPKAEIKDYFCSIKDKYGIDELSDVRIYTEDMFNSYLKYREK